MSRNKYVVYLTTYSGDKHPPYYIGSSSEERVKNGYLGSPSSKEWGKIFKEEVKSNRHLYTIEVLQTSSTREGAFKLEREWQEKYNVVKDKNFCNKAFVTDTGFFGLDVSGENNPMYGVEVSEHRRAVARQVNLGIVVASDDNGKTWKRVQKEHFWERRYRYVTPSGAFNHNTTKSARKRVLDGTHHFCDPEVQRKIHEKRALSWGGHTAESKSKLSESTTKRFESWENKLFTDESREVWRISDKIFDVFLEVTSDTNNMTKTGKLRRGVPDKIIHRIYLLTGKDVSIGCMTNILRKIRSGWNPYEDYKYLEWRG